MNIKLVLEYDGSGFCGWQLQPRQRTVQGILEEAVCKLTGEAVRVHGSGRTDAGVHAMGQVASFKTESTIAPVQFKGALNGLLPSDVRVHCSEEVPEEFHARYSAKGKTYTYKLVVAEYAPPLLRNRAWAIRKCPDAIRLRAILAGLVGTYDFAAFCSTGSNISSTVRTITNIDVVQQLPDNMIHITISADGFLYNMVRIIIAGALKVTSDKLPEDIFLQALSSRKRSMLPFTAPPQGLYLMRVEY